MLNSGVCFIPPALFKTYLFEREREHERVSTLVGSLAKLLQRQDLDKAKFRSLELNWGLLCGCQEASYLTCHLLSPRVSIFGELRPGIKLRHSIEYLLLHWHLSCWAKCLSLFHVFKIVAHLW